MFDLRPEYELVAFLLLQLLRQIAEVLVPLEAVFERLDEALHALSAINQAVFEGLSIVWDVGCCVF